MRLTGPMGFGAAALCGALLATACTSGGDDQADAPTTTTAVPITSTTTTTAVAPHGPVAAPVRHGATDKAVYFVLTDRFANGDPTNDRGGIEGGPLDHGFLPTDTGFHHGGDLAGLIEQLPYIADLGMGALWITPPFTNRTVQGDGTIAGSSSGYHGYWQVNWDQVDPHLGTDADLRRLVDEAHALDIDVYLDAVVNHTGDVISFADTDRYAYIGSGQAPFLTADGVAFDPSTHPLDEPFPRLDPDISFPYVPVVDPGAPRKAPDWLNDVTLYHNRGNTTFSGESTQWGDFFGLDDLFTEHPRVVDGMIDIHTGIIDRYGIDGFRLDTMKHVDLPFWQQFVPAVLARGNATAEHFTVFGEVKAEDPILASTYTNAGVPSTLDFVVAGALGRYVADGTSGEFLDDAFDDDDWYLDADTNASMQMTFLSNHDDGRLGRQIDVANRNDDERLARMLLGHDLLFLIRGQPVVYYGDEQGFTGDGGDQLARAPMFAAQAPAYLDDDNIGSDRTPADDNFDTSHPIYRRITELTELRNDHRAFVTGAQIQHPSVSTAFAFSRIDRRERLEHLVVANSSGDASVTLTVPTRSRTTDFVPIHGAGPEFTTGPDGSIEITIPPLTVWAWAALAPVAVLDTDPTITIIRPDDGAEIPTNRYRLEASAGDDRLAEVTWAVSVDGADPVVLGVDDAPPYRVYWDRTALAPGVSVELIATIADGSGRFATDTTSVTIGPRR